MKNYITPITIGALALLIVATPFTSFAKNDNNKKLENNSKKEQSRNNEKNKSDDNDDDDNDQSRNINSDKSRDNDDDDMKKNKNNSNNTCLKAYGHLFNFGWSKKNNDSISESDKEFIRTNCYLPFGISKKFRGNNASTTSDVTAPVISNIVSSTAKKQAEVRWMTDEYSDSVVFWNTTNTIDTSDTATQKVVNNNLTKKHQVILRNLTPDTTYYVIVRSRDVTGNKSLSSVSSFKTKAISPDAQLPVISNVVTAVGTTTINVGWKTNENATDRVYFSTTLPVVINASTTSYVSNASSTKNHALTIPGLNPNTTYYIIIESTDTAGNVTTSATFSAHTNSINVPADVTPPVSSALNATPGSSTTTVTWTTNELATSKVFYSSTNPLDINATTTSFISDGSLKLNHSISVMGLATSTAYYFKVQSVDASGNTVTSGQVNATTTSGM